MSVDHRSVSAMSDMHFSDGADSGTDASARAGSNAGVGSSADVGSGGGLLGPRAVEAPSVEAPLVETPSVETTLVETPLVETPLIVLERIAELERQIGGLQE